MKNTVRFNTPYEDEEEAFPRRNGRRESFNRYAIPGNSNVSHRNGVYSSHSSQRPFQDLIFVLYGLDEYQKQGLENEIFLRGGSVSAVISERVKFYFSEIFFLYS